ncbi:MAG TPA: NAD(+)/NADH kinase [Verrucomicrobiae bacterium]|nr:NAD(+)/NADH kinase [Verrucomicrobiae bacterium]
MAKTLSLVFNKDKPMAEKVAQQVKEWLEKQGVRVIADPAQSHGADAVIVLGGDGTLLRAARQFSYLGIPLLGINMGRLGFLTEIELADLYPSLENLLADKYTLEERMMLKGTVIQAGTKEREFLALNDVVISRGNISRIITLDISISGELLSSYPADGLIVCTPTGSTAYSLSAGGPVVSPLVQVMVITPICPHTLSARPTVVDPTECIEVRFLQGIDCVVTFDGQETIELNPGDCVRIEQAAITTKLIKLSGRSFPKLLRVKLKDNLHD